jgi:asparagine synthase (glutamine-hydrolysing)
MVASMIHRGPDGDGFWVENDVGLGMRRLSIMDIEGGKQPLASEDGLIRMVFNGEIYNHEELRQDLLAAGHRFTTRTDGEVIPHLYEQYGLDAVARLDGLFAFALWDVRERRLLLARDHLGVKPLYFHVSSDGIRFASELKALLCDAMVPRRLDRYALDNHLTFRFTPAPATLLEGVRKLQPATYMVFTGRDEQHSVRYWDPPPLKRQDLSLEAAAGEFRERLRIAVRRQMMSDRPIGAMLSGGIDSAAIVGLMAEEGATVRTFTVGFEGDGDSDETPLARETAQRFSTEHHDIVLRGADFRDELPAVIEMLEEPVATSSALGFGEVSKLARQHVPVLLSGQGADELLGGYWRYVGEWISGRALPIVNSLRLGPQLARASRRVRSLRLERGLTALRYPDTLDRFLQTYAVFRADQKDGLYGDDLKASLGHNDGPTPGDVVEQYRTRADSRGSLSQMMFVDLRLWLPDDLLLVGDKMSMAESVEMRVPFLDRELVEFAESLPTRYKVRWGVRKVVHKRAMRGLLPPKIIHRKERGFATPIDRWLRGADLGDYARELLLDSDGICAELMDRNYVSGLLELHRAGLADNTRQIFCLLSLELWGRRFLRST